MRLPAGTWLCNVCDRVNVGRCPDCQGRPPKRTKYGNRKCSVDGHTFASKKEAERYLVLKDMEAKGEILSLRLQPSYDCIVHGKTVCRYLADFSYILDGDPQQYVVEDVKSEITRRNPVYRLKRKLVFACHGITILEV